jgi:hypothetical protein
LVYEFTFLRVMLRALFVRLHERWGHFPIATALTVWLTINFLSFSSSQAQVLNPAQAGVIESGYGITPNLTGASDIFASGNYAYVVGSGDALEIIDITLPGLPAHKGILYNGAGGASILQPKSVFVQGKYAYITSFGANALEIVDISNPAQPVHKGVANNILHAWQVTVVGNYAYVMCGSRGYTGALQIVDISNPAAPILKGNLADGGGSAPFFSQFDASLFTVHVSGNYAYIGSYNSFEIIDISDPSNPTHVGVLQGILGGDSQSSIYVVGDIAYCSSGGTVYIVDVSDRTNPSLISSLDGSSQNVPFGDDIYVSGNYAYLSTAVVLDVSNPAAPALVGSYEGRAPGRKMSVQGHYLYLTGGMTPTITSNAITIIDVSTPVTPKLKATLTNGSSSGPLLAGASSVHTSGNYAYVVSETNDALEIIDVSNPAAPTHKSSLVNGSGGAMLNGPSSVFISGTYAYITSVNSQALEIVDVSNPALPIHKASLVDGTGGAFINTPKSIYVWDNYAYIADLNGVLEIVDISNKTAPVHIGKLTDGGGVAPYLSLAKSVYVFYPYAYVASDNALEIIDVSDPANPVHKGALRSGPGNYIANPLAVTVTDTHAYVTSTGFGFGALEIVDVTDPANPVHAGSLVGNDPSVAPYLSTPVGISVSGNTAFVVTTGLSKVYNSIIGGLVVIDITDRTNPVYQASILNGTQGALIDSPTSLFVSGSYAYVTNSGAYQNLDIINLYGPGISSFTPPSGKAGSTVTISGLNFNTFITASIGGVPATVTSVAENTLTITVPTAAVNGKIGLNYNGLALNSDTNFLVTPDAATASAIQQTTLQANWSDVGAASYSLDVSTDNFNSFVGSYQNLSVGNVTNTVIAGLSAGVTYQYRVRSSDGAGLSDYSNTISALTLPAAPAPGAATSVTSSSFTVSWPAITGASGYYAEVSTDAGFSANLPLYNNLLVSATSQTVNGLSAGTTYYLRLKSTNASGNSPLSNVITVATIPSDPAAQAATNVSTNGFTANWSAIAGATSYYIDISTDNFNTLVNGYANLQVFTNSLDVTSLGAGVVYQYRVRSANATGNSANSNTIAVLTLTPVPAAQPTNIAFTDQTGNSVIVSFTQAQGNPSGYIALRSSAAQPSVTPVNGTTYAAGALLGNATVAYVGSALSFFDGGLPTSAIYRYSIYAYNGSGTSVVYLTTSPLQGAVTLDVTPPVINAPANPNPTTVTNGNTPTFNAVITDNISVSSAQIFYRGITKGTFKSAFLSPTGFGGNYSIQIQTTWYDSLGMEYYFAATDGNGNTTTKPVTTNFVQLVNPSITLPALPSGSSPTSYRIVAFPYQLATDNKVTTVYSGVPWNDNTKAAMWWWDPAQKNGAGAYDQYGVSTELQTVDIGKGYWMITSTPVSPQLTNIAASKYNRSNLYTMTLKPGWNEVGNPYPVNISWDDVIALNQKINPGASFSPLSVYDEAGYSNATGSRMLKAFEGGFVKNLGTADISIQIPFAGQTDIGGREQSIGSDLSSDRWNVFLHISQEEQTNKLGGFGMHPQALTGADRYDNFNPPKFQDSPEIRFFNPGKAGTTFSNEMVSTASDFVWHFVPDGKAGKTMQLTWPSQLKTNGKELYLFDEERVQAIDMTQVSSYSFVLSSTSKFSIYYGTNVLSELSSQNIIVSAPYPNPVNNGNTTFHLALPDGDDYHVKLSVIDVYGKTVGELHQSFAPGFQQLEFILAPTLPSGIYIYSLSVECAQTARVVTGKLVKP